MIFQEVFRTFAVASVLLPAIYVLGGIFRFWVIDEDTENRFILEWALGLLVLVLGLSALGQFFLFRWEVVGATLVLVVAIGFHRTLEFFSGMGRLLRRLGGIHLSEKAVGGALLLFFSLTVGLCFLPEIANDSLAYQLSVAKSFAGHASLRPFADDFNSYTSIFFNSLFALGLVFKSTALAKLFHGLTAFFLTAALIFKLERETGAKFFSRLAGLLLFLTPTVFFEAPTTYVDVAVSFFIGLSFFQFERGLLKNCKENFVIAGLLFGIAVAIKILILITVVPFAALFLAYFIKAENKKERLLQALGMFTAALAASGYWFVQSYLLTGNPFFPVLGSFFGTMDLGKVDHFISMGPPKSLAAFFMLPFTITFRPQDYDGGYPIGPLFLMLLPFGILAARKSRACLGRMVFMGIFLAVWFSLFHNVRFLLPALWIYAAAGFCGLYEFWAQAGGRVRFVIKTAGILLAVLLGTVGIYHYRAQWPVLAGLESRDIFLRSMERSYPLAVWMEENLPENARILNAEEIRRFYFPRENVRENWFYLKNRYDSFKDPAALSVFLKERGFTHLLMRRLIAGQAVQEVPRYKLLRALLDSPGLVKQMAFVKSENVREARCEYVIGELL